MRFNAMLVTHHLPEESMPWMEEARTVFDELVIFIDENRVRTGTVDRARKVGSRVHLYKADTWYEWDLGSKARACESDWVFQIEYDEQLSPEWQQDGWRQLLETTNFTHFWILRRWTVPGGRYIRDNPWWPDFQLRLCRSNQKGATFPTRLHDPIRVPGPGAAFRSHASKSCCLAALASLEASFLRGSLHLCSTRCNCLMAGKKIIFVTGSSGLIGSEVCLFFHEQGFAVHGLDNNRRAAFSARRATRDGIKSDWRA